MLNFWQKQSTQRSVFETLCNALLMFAMTTQDNQNLAEWNIDVNSHSSLYMKFDLFINEMFPYSMSWIEIWNNHRPKNDFLCFLNDEKLHDMYRYIFAFFDINSKLLYGKRNSLIYKRLFIYCSSIILWKSIIFYAFTAIFIMTVVLVEMIKEIFNAANIWKPEIYDY